MWLLAATYSAEVTASATKVGSRKVFGEGEYGMKELSQFTKREYNGASYAVCVNWVRGRLMRMTEHLVAVCREREYMCKRRSSD